MIDSRILVLIIILWIAKPFYGDTFRQERAQIKYANPKYLTDTSAFTARRNRNEPYLTNLTGNFLQLLDANISISVSLILSNGHNLKMTYTLCEAFKSKWIIDFLNTHSDVTPKCPLPPRTYHFFNVELPPKNFPIPMPNGDYELMFSIFITDTRERMADAKVFLHFEKKGSGKKSNG